MDNEMAAPARAVGNHIAALHLIITDLAHVIHGVAPDALEARLREVRLEFQALEAGRLSQANHDDLDARQMRLALLERCVAESRAGT